MGLPVVSGGSSAACRIAHGLADIVEQISAGGGEIEPYLRRYLPEHVAECGDWSLLDAVELVDRLDPLVVAMEAWRAELGVRGQLPDAVVVTGVAHAELSAHADDSEARQLTRALTSARMGIENPTLTSPQLAWARPIRVTSDLTIASHTVRVSGVAFGSLPGGRVVLASGGSDQTVRLWDPVTGQAVGDPLVGHTSVVTGVAFGTLPGGRVVLASSSWDETVRLWDPVTGQAVGDPLVGHSSVVTGVAFGTLPGGRVVLASSSSDQTVRLWDPVTSLPAGDPFIGHTGGVSGVVFGTLSDGRVVLASSSWDPTVRLWDPATGQAVGDPLNGHRNGVSGVVFGTLSDGRVVLASSSWDATVRLWDPAVGLPVGVPLTGHTGSVTAVAFGTLSDGRTVLASSSDDRTVRLWRIDSLGKPALIRVLDLSPSVPQALCLAGSLLIVGCEDSLVALTPIEWSPERGANDEY